MRKIMSVMLKLIKIKVTTFLVLISRKTCLMSHSALISTYQNKSSNQHSLTKFKILVLNSKAQLYKWLLNLLNILRVDAIELIARKNIVSVLRMVESAPKSVFASIVIINQQQPVSKLMYSNSGKCHTCSKIFKGNVEAVIFKTF